MPEQYQYSREAAKLTLGKVESWEELNAAMLGEGDVKFKEATQKYWKKFAVSGVLQFDSKEGKQVLRPFTDLDGRAALGVLKEAGIDTSRLQYVKPGEYLEGAVNLDTGDKFGVVYEELTYTTYFDHHASGTKEVTSTAELVYKTMIDLGMVERTDAMDRLIKFVTDIDNRRLPAEEFLRSGKTILGLQRTLDFDKLLLYFKNHKSPTEELTPEEFEKYGLKKAAEEQQKIVDESMVTLERMEQEGKVITTKYGTIVLNRNNELRAGSSAAYIRHDGIINFTPDTSFAVTLKEKDLNEEELRQRLGNKFQGKIIRGKMWIYNEKEPLNLSLEEIVRALGQVTKEVSPEDAYEVEVRNLLDTSVPIERARMIDVLKENKGFQDELKARRFLQKHIDSLKKLSFQEIKNRIYKEWQEGDDTLIVAFLLIPIVRIGADAREEDEKDIRLETSETALEQILSNSRYFSKRYNQEDLIAWIKQKEEMLRHFAGITRKIAPKTARQAHRPLSRNLLEDYKVLDRILGGGREPENIKALHLLINKDIRLEIPETEEWLAKVFLYSSDNAKHELMSQLQYLLRLYKIRDLLPEM